MREFFAQYGYVVVGILVLALVALSCVLYRRTRDITPPRHQGKYRFAQPDERIESRVTRMLSRAVAIPTVHRRGDEMEPLIDLLESSYPAVHQALQREEIDGNLLYRWAGRQKGLPPVLFCSHLDTVDEGPGQWTHPPYSGRVENGYVWGRGALDSKCTLICLMESVEQLLDQGFAPERDVYLAITRDEESDGHQGAAAIAGALRERGIRLELVLDEGDFILKNFLGEGANACAVVNVAEKGVMDLALISRDKGGHAAYPGRHTGLGRLCEAVARVESAPMPRQLIPLTEDYFDAIAPMMNVKYRMMIANRWLFRRPLLRGLSRNAYFRALVTNTVSATMAHGSEAPTVLPRNSWCVLNIRPLPGTSAAEVHHHILNLVEPLGVTTKVLSQSEPSEGDCRQSAAFQKLCDAIHSRFGEQVIIAPCLTARTSDARHFEPICQNVMRFTPLVIKEELKQTIHGMDERAPVAALGAAAEFYMDFIRRTAGTPEKAE